MRPGTTIDYGDVRTVNMSFEEAVSKLEAALKSEGFGVLCQIDMQAKMKEKLGIDFPRYLILGVCNPPLAHQALQADIDLGLLLPCNAIVYEKDGQVRIGAVSALSMLSVAHHTELERVAQQVDEKLGRALDSVAPGSV